MLVIHSYLPGGRTYLTLLGAIETSVIPP